MRKRKRKKTVIKRNFGIHDKKKKKESGLLTQSIMQLYYAYLWSTIFDAIIVKLTLDTTIIEFAIDIVATKFTILQPYSLL